jgi:hypothetical protein
MWTLLLVACVEPEPGGAARPERDPPAPAAPEVRPWTVAVFLNGDNDLEEYVLHDLNELEAGDAGDAAHVVVQADRIDGYDDANGDWTGARRYEIRPDDDTAAVSSRVVEHLGEVDMGDPEVLVDFIAWVDANYPSERLLLVLWNHGDGWLARGGPPGAISYDDTSGTAIEVANGELADALARREAGPVDLLAFDGCNMGAWEVAYALRDVTAAQSFAQSWVGWEGLQYDATLDRIGEEPTIDALTLADVTARDAVELGGERTWAAVDSAGVDALTTAIDALADHLRAGADPVGTFTDLRDATRSTDVVWHDWYLDMGSLAGVAAANPDVAAGAAPLVEALDSAVIGAYGDERLGWSSGLALFGATDDADYLTLYQTGAWAAATDWDELLVEVRTAETGL